MDMTNRKYYAAYGSNLNLSQMSRRCPSAKVVGKAMLKGYRLAFRGVATIEKDEKAETPVGVWAITESDERALDRYEGYPSYYRKEYVKLTVNGEEITAMVYVMNSGEPQMPSRYYLETIVEGYYDVGLDTIYLKEALEDTERRTRIKKAK
jgi:gamma-glutamylcyclotransferase (GGCT)/AIG2-like uncharacterized protein YtfP